ncbi:MAG: hypothetical protein WC639_05395 [Patescibacteria group bacterium]|jgi:hypothetical protein
MNPKTLVWIGVFIGGAVGGYIPTLFGAGGFSVESVIGNTIGGLIGIWAGFKASQFF